MGWGELKCGLWGILFGQVEVKFKALEKKTWGRATVEADQHRRRATERERDFARVCVHVFNM